MSLAGYIVHGVVIVGHDLGTKLPPPIILILKLLLIIRVRIQTLDIHGISSICHTVLYESYGNHCVPIISRSLFYK